MIKDLKENVATRETLLCQAVEEKVTKNGDTHVDLLLSDRENSIKVKVWNTNKGYMETFVGRVIDLTVTPEIYNGKMSYKGDMIALKPDASITDFVPKAPYPSDRMFDALMQKADSFQNEDAKKLVQSLMTEHKEKLLCYPAAQTIHHNCYGGLIYHMFRMAGTASYFITLYKTVNKDILLAGVILHDIGKLEELDGTEMGTAEYSVSGHLFGHIYLGMRMVEREAERLQIDKSVTEQVLHIIASHHGQPEWGALTRPQTLEAFLVHELDMIDSRAYQYEKSAQTISPGEFTQKVFGLGTSVYRPMENGGGDNV